MRRVADYSRRIFFALGLGAALTGCSEPGACVTVDPEGGFYCFEEERKDDCLDSFSDGASCADAGYPFYCTHDAMVSSGAPFAYLISRHLSNPECDPTRPPGGSDGSGGGGDNNTCSQPCSDNGSCGAGLVCLDTAESGNVCLPDACVACFDASLSCNFDDVCGSAECGGGGDDGGSGGDPGGSDTCKLACSSDGDCSSGEGCFDTTGGFICLPFECQSCFDQELICYSYDDTCEFSHCDDAVASTPTDPADPRALHAADASRFARDVARQSRRPRR